MDYYTDFFDFDDDPFFFYDMPYRRYMLDDGCRHGSCGKRHHCRKSIKDSGDLVKFPKMMQRLSGFGRMDLHESNDEYSLALDLPGMNKDEIKVTTEDGRLVIEGERQMEYKDDGKDGSYRIVERHSGSFRRELPIPKDANVDKINAVYDNGVLKVTFPKTGASSDVKRITVNYSYLLTKTMSVRFVYFQHGVRVVT